MQNLSSASEVMKDLKPRKDQLKGVQVGSFCVKQRWKSTRAVFEVCLKLESKLVNTYIGGLNLLITVIQTYTIILLLTWVEACFESMGLSR